MSEKQSKWYIKMFADKFKVETSYTFDDVLIEPAESWVEPNTVDVKSVFTKNIP